MVGQMLLMLPGLNRNEWRSEAFRVAPSEIPLRCGFMLRWRVLVPVLVFVLASASAGEAQTLNQNVVTYLNARVGTRVGGGECAHAACESLRAAGAEFISSDLGADFPSPGDTVWGTLVKVVSYTNDKWADSAPSVKVQAGDILQYRDTKFVYGNSWSTASRHTTVVSLVNAVGMPTQVFEQNYNGVRTLGKNAIDLTKLKQGWVRIYRPKARVNRAGQYKFSLVNNVASAQSVTLKIGTVSVSTFSLTAANTWTSYSTRWMTSSSPTKPTLVLPSGSSITLDTAGGYELYSGTGGKVMVRKRP